MTRRRLWLAAVVGCAAAAGLTVYLLRRDSQQQRASPTGSRTEPCRSCHQPVPLQVAHRVVVTFDDDAEGEMTGGGGTAMVAEYHPGCCPGGCTAGHVTVGA